MKGVLRDAAQTGLGTMNPKKPIVPTRAEILANRRARSAKLRIFERLSALSSAESANSSAAILSYA